MAEVYNAITGDLLTENLEQGFNNALCPGKISRSSFKGLTPAMKQAIYDEQAKQRVELKVCANSTQASLICAARHLQGTINGADVQYCQRHI